MSKKYSFIEFIAAMEDYKNFDTIEFGNIPFAEKILEEGFIAAMKEGIHFGDCTQQACPCFLCLLQKYLEDFYEYTFNEKQFREENGILEKEEL